MGKPVCFKLFRNELEITEKEISKLKRLQIACLVVAIPIALWARLYVTFPSIFENSKRETSDVLGSISKYSSIILGGAFFGTISFFNKGNLRELKLRKVELEIFIEEYDEFVNKSEEEKAKLYQDCEVILDKRKWK